MYFDTRGLGGEFLASFTFSRSGCLLLGVWTVLLTFFLFSCRSPFPWFYFVFFMVMIIHRTGRDVARCRRKYGEAWTRYEKEVPYLFIPVSVLCPLC